MKQIGPNAYAKAKAKLDIFTRKRLNALTLLHSTWDDKNHLKEILGQSVN